MFIWTAKVDRKKIQLVLAATVLCVAAVFALAMGGLKATASGAGAGGAIHPKGVKTEEDRVNYLTQWGWLTGPEAVAVEELELPKELGPEYSDYLALQAGQGFDLTRHAGKRIKRYTYDVLNYPGVPQGVQIHLLIRKNTVIGGEVLGPGFLHGFQYPEG